MLADIHSYFLSPKCNTDFQDADPLHKVLTSFTEYIRVDGNFAPFCTYKAYVYEWDSSNFRIVGNALFEGPTQLVSSLSTSQMGAVTETIPSVILDPTKYVRVGFGSVISCRCIRPCQALRPSHSIEK